LHIPFSPCSRGKPAKREGRLSPFPIPVAGSILTLGISKLRLGFYVEAQLFCEASIVVQVT